MAEASRRGFGTGAGRPRKWPDDTTRKREWKKQQKLKKNTRTTVEVAEEYVRSFWPEATVTLLANGQFRVATRDFKTDTNPNLYEVVMFVKFCVDYEEAQLSSL